MKDGGSAFPKQPVMQLPAGVELVVEQGGMSLRDYFASHASETDVQRYMPDDIGDTADLLVKLGRIRRGREGRKFEWYSTADRNWLRAWARYQFADDMLKASGR